MVYPALLAIVLAAPAQAAPVAASLAFESSVFESLHRIAQTRADSIKKLDAGLAARLNWLCMDIRQFQVETTRLRNETTRMRQRLIVIPGRPADPSLAFDVRRLAQDFQQLARDMQWKLQDARVIRTSIQGKDQDLVLPASYFASEILWMSNETRWLDMETRNMGWDLRAMGYVLEAMDIDQAVRDIQADTDGLKAESDLITAKIR